MAAKREELQELIVHFNVSACLDREFVLNLLVKLKLYFSKTDRLFSFYSLISTNMSKCRESLTSFLGHYRN